MSILSEFGSDLLQLDMKGKLQEKWDSLPQRTRRKLEQRIITEIKSLIIGEYYAWLERKHRRRKK